MRASTTVLFCIFCLSHIFSQDSIGTIKVSKKNFFAKAVYDNIENKIVAIDKLGNPIENAVISFKASFLNTNGETKTFVSESYRLNSDMIRGFKDQEFMQEIRIHDIMAIDPFGNIEKLNDFNDQCGIKLKSKRKKQKLKTR